MWVLIFQKACDDCVVFKTPKHDAVLYDFHDVWNNDPSPYSLVFLALNGGIGQTPSEANDLGETARKSLIKPLLVIIYLLSSIKVID